GLFFCFSHAIIHGLYLTIKNVGLNTTRDGVVEILRRMGVVLECSNERHEAGERVADIRVRGGALTGVTVGSEMVARTIDEYPILSVAAALAHGVTTFLDIKELRYKESDGTTAMSEHMHCLGIE